MHRALMIYSGHILLDQRPLHQQQCTWYGLDSTRPDSRSIAQILMHCLDLSVRLQPIRSKFSADTTHLEPSKGYAGMQEAILVTPDCPRVESGRDSEGLARVITVHCGAKAVRRIVGEFYGFGFGLEFGNDHDGPENLLVSSDS